MYNQSPASVSFYEFLRTMGLCKFIIAENTSLVLSPDRELFKYIKVMGPKQGICHRPRTYSGETSNVTTPLELYQFASMSKRTDRSESQLRKPGADRPG